MAKISSVLQRSAELCGPNPFCVDRTNGVIVSYNAAWSIAMRHRQWIEVVVSNCIAAAENRSGFNKQQMVLDSANNEVIVAYLSANCPDLILSILGTMDIGGDDLSSSNSCGRRVIPAMPNARWTAHEIASVLRVSSDDNNSQSKRNFCSSSCRQHHITVILYGSDFDILAKETCETLKRWDGDLVKDGWHMVVVLPYPFYTSGRGSAFSPSPPLAGTNATCTMHDACCSKSDMQRRCIHDDAIILFTSGTSSANGKAKGVKLSHLSLLVQATAKVFKPCSYDSSTRMLTTVSLFHVGGLSSILAVIVAGGTLIFPRRRDGLKSGISFDVDEVLDALGGNSATPLEMSPSLPNTSVNTLVVVPAMIHSLLAKTTKNHDDADGQMLQNGTFRQVRMVLIGGQSVSVVQYEQSRRLFPNARFVQTYACTEAGSSITFAELSIKNNPFGQRQLNASISAGFVGTPPGHINICIFPEGSEQLKSDENPFLGNNSCRLRDGCIGLIGTRGSHIMTCYWTRKHVHLAQHESTRSLRRPGDWLITGDLGYVEGGNRLFFCGRVADVIRTGGETVFAPEVERIVETHPQIERSAVFPLPDNKFGEIVCVAVSLVSDRLILRGNIDEVFEATSRKETQLLPDQIRDTCKMQHLAGYKWPRRMYIFSQLPENSSGKLLKSGIRTRIMSRAHLGSKL